MVVTHARTHAHWFLSRRHKPKHPQCPDWPKRSIVDSGLPRNYWCRNRVLDTTTVMRTRWWQQHFSGGFVLLGDVCVSQTFSENKWSMALMVDPNSVFFLHLSLVKEMNIDEWPNKIRQRREEKEKERWKERKLITPHTDIIFPATSARKPCIVFSRHKATLFSFFSDSQTLSFSLFISPSYIYMLQRCLEKIVEPLVTGAPLILFSRGEK